VMDSSIVPIIEGSILRYNAETLWCENEPCCVRLSYRRKPASCVYHQQVLGHAVRVVRSVHALHVFTQSWFSERSENRLRLEHFAATSAIPKMKQCLR